MFSYNKNKHVIYLTIGTQKKKRNTAADLGDEVGGLLAGRVLERSSHPLPEIVGCDRCLEGVERAVEVARRRDHAFVDAVARLPVRAEEHQGLAPRKPVAVVQEQPSQIGVAHVRRQPFPQREQCPPRAV